MRKELRFIIKENTDSFIDLDRTIAAPLLRTCEKPWEALPKIKDFILGLIGTLSPDEYDCPAEGIMIAKTAKVAPTASIAPPCIICDGAEIRHCAFIRGSVIVGKGAVVGNSTELKNCILSDGVQVPHYNYIGDSILGYKAHMGAGAVTSNVKSDKSNVTIRDNRDGTRTETGLRKFGAIVGNRTEVGCGAVLNPGTVLGTDCTVYPLSSVRGFIPARHIFKASGNITEKIERN